MDNKTTLVVGASGATGKYLVAQLLKMGQKVKVIVRSKAKIPDYWIGNDEVSIIEAEISTMDELKLSSYIKDCHAVACCLGHNMTWKGIYGQPRKLVTNTVRLICKAIERIFSQKPFKLVLMNTAGNRNRDLAEPLSFGERCATGLIRLILPPHTDNESAAEFLRENIGQVHQFIEWVVIRPDSLIDQNEVTDYSLFASPTRSALFNPGKTSRINVGHVMAKLIVEDNFWHKWKGQMPVLYNKEKDKRRPLIKLHFLAFI